jgi:hypothetical protein
MAKKGGGDGWGWFFGLAAAGLVLYGVKVAIDEENKGSRVPADPGGQIDLIVNLLNDKFTHRWATLGLNVLKAYLESKLPKPVVGLVDAIYQAEQYSGSLNGAQKKQIALNAIQRS